MTRSMSASEASRLANDCPGGAIEAHDWLTAADEAGSFQLATVKIGKELALLRAGKKEQATQNRKHLSWLKARSAMETDCPAKPYRATELTKRGI